MNEILPTHKQYEDKCVRETMSKHGAEAEIMYGLLNTFIVGFNLVTSFTREEGKNDVTYALIFLVTHSFHSMLCSAKIMLKGYYSQAASIIRTSVEDWFICCDCKSNIKTLDAIINNSDRIPSRGELSFKQMAIRIKAEKVYEQDYAHASKFSHPSSLGMAILNDLKTNLLRIAPTYEEGIFLDCAKLWIRNSLRMTEHMKYILDSIDQQKAEQ